MAINSISTSARNAACDGFVDQYDVGTTNPGARVELYTSEGGTLLGYCQYSAPAFGNAGAVNPGEAVANAITDGTGLAAGTMTVAHWVDRDGAVVHKGTAGLSGADINFSAVLVAVSDVIKVTSAKITMPAS